MNSVYALHEALRLVLEEGLEARFARHARLGAELAAGLEGLGLALPHQGVEAALDGRVLGGRRLAEVVDELEVVLEGRPQGRGHATAQQLHLAQVLAQAGGAAVGGVQDLLALDFRLADHHLDRHR